MEEEMEIILRAVDNISDTFQSIASSVSSLGDTISDVVDGASNEFEGITDNVTDFHESVENIDDSTLQELADALGMDTDRVKELLDAGADIGSMSSQFGEVGDAAEETGDKVEKAKEKVEEFGSAGDVAGSELLLNFVSNLSDTMESLADRAGNVQDSLSRMGTVADGLGINVDSLKTAISDLAEETGRSGGTIRESFINMMSAGVTDIEDMQATFAGASAQSYLLGTDVSALADKFTSMAMKSKVAEKSLKGTGITVEELGETLGLQNATIDEVNEKWAELDTSQRAAALGLAASMNEGKDANDEYKNSWQGLQDQIKLAEGKIMTMAGNILLPVFVPAMQKASDILSELGSALDGVMKGPFGGLISILVSAAASFGLVYGGIMYVKDALAFLKIESLITGGYQALLTLQNLLLGETSLAAALGLAAEGEAASLASIEFMGLSLAELAALWPLALIVAAIVALIAIIYEVGKAFGWWTDVNTMLEAIGAGLQKLWDAFINHPDVQAAIAAISGALSTLWSWIQQAGQAILEFFGVTTGGDFDIVQAIIDSVGEAWDRFKEKIMMVVEVATILWNTINWVFTTIWSIVGPIIMQIVGLVQGLIGAFDQFKSGQMNLPQLIMTVLSLLANTYMSIFNYIVGLVKSFASKMVNKAIAMAREFVTNIINWIRQLPGRVYSFLLQVASRIASAGAMWVRKAVQSAKEIVSNVVSKLSGLPGQIASAVSGVANAIVKPFKDAYEGVCKWVDDIKKKAAETVGIARGGETAAGGEIATDTSTGGLFNIATGQYLGTDNKVVIEDNINLTLDLKNVPANINTAQLIAALQDKEVLSALVNNRDFQSIDAQVKQRISLKNSRSGR